MRALYIVEQEPDRRLLRGLGELNHVVETAASIDDGLAMAGFGGWDAIVCDLRSASPEPVAAISAAAPSAWLVALCPVTEAKDRIELLSAGADLVLPRPYEFRELSAHMEAMTRRGLRSGRHDPSPVQFDLRPAQLAVVLGRETIALSPQEFALLSLLASHPGEVMGVERILASVWGGHVEPRPELVHTFVSRLRGKLERGRPWKLIHAARGHGYSFRIEPLAATHNAEPQMKASSSSRGGSA